MAWRHCHWGHFNLRKTWGQYCQSGYLGITYEAIINKWCKCQACQVFHNHLLTDPLSHVEDVKKPSVLISVDFISPVEAVGSG